MSKWLFLCGASRDIEGEPMSISEARALLANNCGGNCADCPALAIEIRDKDEEPMDTREEDARDDEQIRMSMD